MKVLIVDDSIVYRSQIKTAVKNINEDCIVLTASNGKSGLELIQSESPDLIILDMEMPVMNGMEVLDFLQNKKIKNKTVIFSSITKRGTQMAFEALKKGAIDIIGKPSGENTSLSSAALEIEKQLTTIINQVFITAPPNQTEIPNSSKKQYSKIDFNFFCLP